MNKKTFKAFILSSLTLSALLLSTGSQAGEGGVNGGGGGTLPAEPISTYDVLRIVQKAKKTLDPFVKYQIFNYDRSSHESYELKLYGGSTTLWDILQNTNIEIELNNACHDAYGKEVDASIHAQQQNSICLSAFRIAPKLIKERAETEILALILHELSHKLGTTEKEAQAFQKSAAYYLSSEVAKISSEQFVKNAQVSSERLQNLLRQINNDFSNLNDQELLARIELIMTALSKFDESRLVEPFSIFNRKELDYFILQRFQFEVAYWAVLASGDTGTYWQNKIDKAFAGRDFVTEGDFNRRINEFEDPNTYSNEIISKIKNRQDLQKLLEAFSRKFAITTQAIRNLWLDSQMGPVADLETPLNPWSAYIGQYQVLDRNCSNSKPDTNLVGFKIGASEGADQLGIVELYSNGYGSNGGLYNGAMVPSGLTAVHIEASGTDVKRIAEMGDRWGERFEQASLEMNKVGSQYSLTTTFLSRRFKSNQWSDEIMSCKMKLQKVVP